MHNRLNSEDAHHLAPRVTAGDGSLRAIMETLPFRVSYWDRNLVNRYANRATQEWFGRRLEAVAGARLPDLMGGQPFELHRPSIERVLQGEPVSVERVLSPRPDGTFAHVLVHYVPDVVDGVVLGFYLLIHDTTPPNTAVAPPAASADHRPKEQTLVESESKFRSLFELAPVGIALNDLDTGGFLHVNEALAASTGHSREELLQLTLRDVIHGAHRESHEALFGAFAGTGRFGPCEMEFSRKGGGSYPVLVSGIRIRDADGRSLVWSLVQDISARKTVEAELADAARRDKLTGLSNRALFMERLEKAIARVRAGTQRLFAVLFLDFDRFKLINDTLGHDGGDELLRQIAARLRRELRAADLVTADETGNVVSRFGGDEFLLLINDVKEPSGAVRIAERLLNALAPAYDVHGRDAHSSASIGIVTSDQCRGSADDVVRNADVAMYEAKRAGRACSVVFNEAMQTRMTRHVTIETNLRRALGTAELEVLYQPVVELSTGRVVSAEALIRWRHSVLGEILPCEFIPIAGESGLIVALGQWLMREACEALAGWRRRDPARAPATVSVNLSRAELASGQRLIQEIRATLERTGLPAGCLQLEFAERDVMRDPAKTRTLLLDLQALGVQLAMDEFGTGSSSLSGLRNHPLNTVKIDRSFLRDLTASPDVLAVAHATINLIENLGMASLAEGVEESAQVAVLLSLGCRYAQGRFLGAPMTAGSFLEVQDTRLAAAPGALAAN